MNADQDEYLTRGSKQNQSQNENKNPKIFKNYIDIFHEQTTVGGTLMPQNLSMTALQTQNENVHAQFGDQSNVSLLNRNYQTPKNKNRNNIENQNQQYTSQMAMELSVTKKSSLMESVEEQMHNNLKQHIINETNKKQNIYDNFNNRYVKKKDAKQKELYDLLKWNYLLPNINTHACKKSNLRSLLTGERAGFMYQQPLPFKNPVKINLYVLHEVVCFEFAMNYGKLIFHQEEFADKQYYETLLYKLNTDKFQEVFTPKPKQKLIITQTKAVIHTITPQIKDRFQIKPKFVDPDGLNEIHWANAELQLEHIKNKKNIFDYTKFPKESKLIEFFNIKLYWFQLKNIQLRKKIILWESKLKLFGIFVVPKYKKKFNEQIQLIDQASEKKIILNPDYSEVMNQFGITCVSWDQIEKFYTEHEKLENYILSPIVPNKMNEQLLQKFVEILKNDKGEVFECKMIALCVLYIDSSIKIDENETFNHKNINIFIWGCMILKFIIQICEDTQIKKLQNLHLIALQAGLGNRDALSYVSIQAKAILTSGRQFLTLKRTVQEVFQSAKFKQFFFQDFVFGQMTMATKKYQEKQHQYGIDIREISSLIISVEGHKLLEIFYNGFVKQSESQILLQKFTYSLPTYDNTSVSFVLLLEVFLEFLPFATNDASLVETIRQKIQTTDLIFIGTLLAQKNQNFGFALQNRGQKNKKITLWLEVCKKYITVDEQIKIVLAEITPNKHVIQLYRDVTDETKTFISHYFCAATLLYLLQNSLEGFDALIASLILWYLKETPISYGSGVNYSAIQNIANAIVSWKQNVQILFSLAVTFQMSSTITTKAMMMARQKQNVLYSSQVDFSEQDPMNWISKIIFSNDYENAKKKFNDSTFVKKNIVVDLFGTDQYSMERRYVFEQLSKITVNIDPNSLFGARQDTQNNLADANAILAFAQRQNQRQMSNGSVSQTNSDRQGENNSQHLQTSFTTSLSTSQRQNGDRQPQSTAQFSTESNPQAVGEMGQNPTNSNATSSSSDKENVIQEELIEDSENEMQIEKKQDDNKSEAVETKKKSPLLRRTGARRLLDYLFSRKGG